MSAFSTISAAYMTETWSATSATDSEIVGDQDQAHPGLLLQVGEKLHDLGLNGDVEGRRRLVGDERPDPKRWPWRSRPVAASHRRTRGGRS